MGFPLEMLGSLGALFWVFLRSGFGSFSPGDAQLGPGVDMLFVILVIRFRHPAHHRKAPLHLGWIWLAMKEN